MTIEEYLIPDFSVLIDEKKEEAIQECQPDQMDQSHEHAQGVKAEIRCICCGIIFENIDFLRQHMENNQIIWRPWM